MKKESEDKIKFDNVSKRKKTNLIISLFFVALICIPNMASAMTHPCLLFDNITETPGYQHRTEEPWKSWENGVIFGADNFALPKDFSDPNWPSYNNIRYRASYARYAALAYQITKDTKYADKAEEALLNLDIGEVRTGPLTEKLDRYTALWYYSITYDWTQSYLNATNDALIRDKLAVLADQVYYNLNDGGTAMGVIRFDDHHAQAYPIMGIAGCVLKDYTNASLNSTPSDWERVGNDYLFLKDPLHSFDRSLISFGFLDDGKHFTGAYKSYWLDEFLWWSQVYSHFYESNIFNDHPIMERILTSELGESLPNRYNNNYGTSGNTKYAYHRGIMSLLNDTMKSYLLRHDDLIEDSDLLPYSSYSAPAPQGSNLEMLEYLTYRDYSDIGRRDPAWTSRLDANIEENTFYQVFRGSWANDSDWLSFITWNTTTSGNRDMGHHDQLSFEYYAKGDLLLADGGEPKHVIDKIYGEDGVFHNTIMIEDPRNPFDVSDDTGSRARVLFKGLANNLVTPASIGSLIQTSWMELVQGQVDIDTVTGETRSIKQPLSSSIKYNRTILYPNKDYFIVVDRLEGTEPWTYRNVFRPSSLSIVPSTGTTEAGVGHVNGSLMIGNTPYNWLSRSYKTEEIPGIETNSIKWNITNPYGTDVELHLFSVPSSEIRVTKHVTRTAGYDSTSEVFLPIVYFRTSKANNELYRVTVLLSRYTSEEEKTPEDVPVSGTGNAVKVTALGYEDYIYAGTGTSSFSDFSTDADTLYVRKAGQPSTFTFMNGTYVNYSGAPLFVVSDKVDHVSLKNEGTNKNFTIKGDGTAVAITLYGMDPSLIYQVKRDSVDYANWGMTDGNTKLVIITDLGEHTFEIEVIGTDDWTRPLTTTTITPPPAETGWNNVTPVVVTFFRSDDLGLAYTNYSKISASGPWTTVSTTTAKGPDARNVTDVSEDTFNVTVSQEGITTLWYYSVNNNGTFETINNVTVKVDTTPPANVSNLQNTSGTTGINWTWTNPEDEDFSHTIVYLDGVFKTNMSNHYYNATQLTSDTRYEIGIRTVDTHGNVNTGWVNQTAKTSIRNSNGALSGTITYANNGTGITGVTVNLTENGTVIASTTTDSNGNYIITEVTSNDYIVTVSKIRFWSNSTSVTVNADETETAHLKLWVKGDLNNNGISADVGDQAMIKDASVGTITADWKYDLNTNGIFSDAGDLAMIKDASVGTIELL